MYHGWTEAHVTRSCVQGWMATLRSNFLLRKLCYQGRGIRPYSCRGRACTNRRVCCAAYAACCSGCLCKQHNVHAQMLMRFFLLRYDGTGFIVNDVQVQGAVFCLADLFMMWNLKSWQELTPDALSMLHLFKPAPGNLIVHACCLGPCVMKTFTI